MSGSDEETAPVEATSQKRRQSVKRKIEDTLDDDEDSAVPEKVLKSDFGEDELVAKEKKHVRKRLKYLLQAVRDQMEFYFSDSNLSKDRFLKKYMDQNPGGYIDLAVFGNFNKLQALHKDGVSLKILTKALARSKVLQLSEDKSKVKRTTPFREISAEETDNRTVYVEYLPNHATHAWIQTIFAPCGKVVYVSLPKYPSTGQIKGFAFVEFQSAEEAEKACNLLNNPPSVKEGDKPGKFPKGNKALYRLQRIVPDKPEDTSNDENVAEDKEEIGKKRKKKKGKRKGVGDTSIEGELPSTVSSTSMESTSQKLAEGPDAKKRKKKKKRKKQGLTQDESLVKDEDEGFTKEKVDIEVCAKDSTKDSEEKEDLREQEEANLKKKKKKKKKKKRGKKLDELDVSSQSVDAEETKNVSGGEEAGESDLKPSTTDSCSCGPEEKTNNEDAATKHVAGRKERKKSRQEDIRNKKREREAQEKVREDFERTKNEDAPTSKAGTDVEKEDSSVSTTTATDRETSVVTQSPKKDGQELTSCLLKAKPQAVRKKVKKVEFDPITVTQEFVRGKEARKRKKSKKDKLQLRVIAKKEWLSLKAEYLRQQKSHMTALKESLRELRQQENQASSSGTEKPGPKHVDLQEVFGTKRLKPSQDVKMAHVEALKFTPNVIVQWKASNEMHRDKIRTMFKDISGDSIAYIDAQEEAKSGYIRFKDEASAEQFAKLSRHSNSFSARVLPVEQQQTYWDKANEDRMKKLSRKKQEKGSERIARKVFERNKVTFHEKSSHIKFEDDEEEEEEKGSGDLDKESKEETPENKGKMLPQEATS